MTRRGGGISRAFVGVLIRSFRRISGFPVLGGGGRRGLLPAFTAVLLLLLCFPVSRMFILVCYTFKTKLSPTHRLHSSSFLGLPYRILNINHKKELKWSLWVIPKQGFPRCLQAGWRRMRLPSMLR